MPFRRRIYQKFEEVLQPLHSSGRSSRGTVPVLQILELNASKTSCFQKLFSSLALALVRAEFLPFQVLHGIGEEGTGE